MIIKGFQTSIGGKYALANQQLQQEAEKNADKTGSKTIFAGNLNMQKEDDIGQLKVREQKKALKLIMDTFESQMGIEDGLSSMESEVGSLEDEAMKNRQLRDQMKGLSDKLVEEYQISEDSKEYKDLKLLQKAESGTVLTKEEQEQLSDMGPKTEFQTKALEYDALANTYQNKADSAIAARSQLEKSIDGIETDLLKDKKMVEGQEAAENILEEASKKAAGMMMADAIEKVDEDQEEMQERTEELKEKKEKEEEKIASTKEEPTDITNNEQIQKSGEAKSKVEAVLIMNRMLDEDIKGIAVDKLI